MKTIPIPPDYDPDCTCGSLIPECPPCKAVSSEYRKRKERLERVAVGSLPDLLAALTAARSERDERERHVFFLREACASVEAMLSDWREHGQEPTEEIRLFHITALRAALAASPATPAQPSGKPS
jgi:hypothetical protein